jgi:hypothetical protein
MPTTITSAGITFNDTTSLTSGTPVDGSITTAKVQDSAITTAKIAANAVTAAKLGANEQRGLCKAFVNFNGTGTIGQPQTIRSSYNVSSITKTAAGFYGINFATPLSDANYSVASSSSRTNTGSAILVVNSLAAVPQSTTAVFVGNLNASTSFGIDESIISVQIFGN